MEPVDSFGEWVGLLAVPVAAVALLVGIVRLAPHAHVSLEGVGRGIDAFACGLDPTDPCNWSIVIVKNDISAPVALRDCIHHCGKGDQLEDPVDVAPGRSSPRDQYQGVSALTGLRTWLVVSVRGRRIGCLVLDGHDTKRDGDVVLVSEARPCGNPHSPTTQVVAHVRM
jgi:hypothetical protein